MNKRKKDHWIVLIVHDVRASQPRKFGLVLWHSNRCRLFNTKSIFIPINSPISKNSV